MPVYSTGGDVSSRFFQTRELERALFALPSSQRHQIRILAGKVNKRTHIGYYAALDLLATIGVYMTNPRATTVAGRPKPTSSRV